MPHQPLSSINRSAGVIFSPLTPEQRPQHAVKIAKAFATATQIDLITIQVLAEMLGPAANAAAAMFMAIRATSAQAASLEALAEAVLSEKEAKLLSAILDICARACADRNRFAHWIWGYSPQLPEHILFQKPEAAREDKIKGSQQTKEIMKKMQSGIAQMLLSSPQPKDVIGYRVKDIDEGILKMERAITLLRCFRDLIDRSFPTTGQEYDQLASEPEVAASLSRRN